MWTITAIPEISFNKRSFAYSRYIVPSKMFYCMFIMMYLHATFHMSSRLQSSSAFWSKFINVTHISKTNYDKKCLATVSNQVTKFCHSKLLYYELKLWFVSSWLIPWNTETGHLQPVNITKGRGYCSNCVERLWKGTKGFCKGRQALLKIRQTVNLPTTKFKQGTSSLTGDDFMIKVRNRL